MSNVIMGSLMNTILKTILIECGCTTDKYLTDIENFNPGMDSRSECYLTLTRNNSGENFIILTKTIHLNWAESVMNIDRIVEYLNKRFNFRLHEYKLILHAYFKSIELDQFYEIKTDRSNSLIKLSLEKFEKMLK
jgi:hypothetical protein